MADREQSYKTHTRFLPPFHFFVVPVLMVNALNEIRHLYMAPTRHNVLALAVALALLALALLSRVMALTVQDRVIRLEERMRMRQVLPGDLQQHIEGLTPRQLVALRFASDSELADLVREVIGGQLPTQKAIKLRVRTWRPDWLRA
jgi:hypothetical protein